MSFLIAALAAWVSFGVGFAIGAWWHSYRPERRQELARGLMVPIEPGRKRNSHRRPRQPWQGPRH